MRKRKIKKTGNSYYVKLEQTDMKDMDLEVGDFVIVSKEMPSPVYYYVNDENIPIEIREAMKKSIIEYGTTENYKEFLPGATSLNYKT